MSGKKPFKVGITGQAGFVGTHLYNELGLLPGLFERVPFEDRFFENPELLAGFARQCDVIVHLAAVNRHPKPDELYSINIGLVQKLTTALKNENAASPHIIFSSSIQESLDNPYGKSKREGRRLLEDWAKENNASFTGLVIPNVYGPFGLPNYNSFVATFCHKLVNGEEPVIITDSEVSLIYVSSLCKHIIDDIGQAYEADSPAIQEKHIPHDFTKSVSDMLRLFIRFKEQYFAQGIIPVLSGINDINLFNTFRSCIDLEKYFPFRLKQNADIRGTFVETIKLGSGGQVSFSTTKPGITRGNHYHTRKIERFTVIKGQARIQLRKIGTNKIYEFFLDGSDPAYVDMPVWYTHNITNIGTGDLYTQFWINEWYDETSPDTYFEQV
jgi:UDP-2-acetamido-2,6-beta-L-arabino-hexul-4-ose reductase